MNVNLLHHGVLINLSNKLSFLFGLLTKDEKLVIQGASKLLHLLLMCRTMTAAYVGLRTVGLDGFTSFNCHSIRF